MPEKIALAGLPLWALPNETLLPNETKSCLTKRWAGEVPPPGQTSFLFSQCLQSGASVGFSADISGVSRPSRN